MRVDRLETCCGTTAFKFHMFRQVAIKDKAHSGVLLFSGFMLAEFRFRMVGSRSFTAIFRRVRHLH